MAIVGSTQVLYTLYCTLELKTLAQKLSRTKNNMQSFVFESKITSTMVSGGLLSHKKLQFQNKAEIYEKLTVP